MGRMTDVPSRRPDSAVIAGTADAPRAVPSIRLHPDLEASLAKGHPWIYRDHLPKGVQQDPGAWVRVQSGRFEAIGVFDPGSPLSIRVYSRDTVPDRAWFERRVASAFRRRAPLLADGQTNAYRLVNGEGDGVPGVVVDVYGPFAVVRLDSAVLAALVPDVVHAVESAIPVKGICQKGAGGLEVLAGRLPPDRLIVSEHGLRFYADLGTGQKTGLFLDHRENRAHLERWSQGCSVLNLFSYTGAFSLYAGRGGARQVVSVDSAGDAMARASDNVALNGLDPDVFEFVTADAYKYLEQLGVEQRKFDIVITDPPSFARNRTQRQRALRAYEKLHGLALAVLAPGGLYAAASCTSQIDVDAFRGSVAAAAGRARRTLQVVLETGQALDHPVMVGHPEGRYLKFVALRSVDD
jgi:23S rRNA (cytosine1962-C5)-methyltransferase